MAISFPTSPSLGDTYTYGSASWTWNGVSWDLPALSTSTFSVVAETARPKKWIKVYRVNPNSLGSSQTGTQTFTTITAAIAQVATDAGAAATGGHGYDPGPEFRRLILIDPGTYNEQITGFTNFTDFIGSSGVAGDVIVTQGGAVPTIEAGGKTSYMANMTILQTGSSSAGGVYPLHDDAVNGSNGSSPNGPQSLVCHNMIFTSQNANRTSAMGIGMPGRSNYLFIGCAFNAYSGGGPALNIHNTASQSFPASCIFYNCTSTANGTSTVLNCTDLGSGQSDRIAWIGGTMVTTGSAQVNLVNSAGSTLQVVLDPSVVTTAVTGATTIGSVSYTTTLPTYGVGGNTKDIETYYYPSKIGQILTIGNPNATPSGFASLTANRLYYMRVPITAAVNCQKILIGCSATGGNVWGGIFTDDGTGKPGDYLSPRLSAVAAAAGTMTLTTGYLRTLYPGIGSAWIGIVADSGTPTFLTSSYLSTIEPCYYQDLTPGFSALPTTATPVAVTAGTVVPVAQLLTS